MKQYDVVIIGGGPAGLTAAIYSLRGGCSVLLIEGNMIGGQCSLSNDISNYPGIKQTTGVELSMSMLSQAEELGLVVHYDLVEKVNLNNKQIFTKSSHFKASCIILCMGAKPRKLNIEKEDELTGNGVHYCATCDGAFYRGKDVIVVGGGNSAAEEAIYLSNICHHVSLVNHGPKLKCQDYFLKSIEKLVSNKKLTIYQNSEVVSLNADKTLKSVVINDRNKEIILDASAVFVAIGRIPDNGLIKGQIELSNNGFVEADENMQTSIDGVFVAGDIREKRVRQIVTACADGAIAGTHASQYINERR